jgi:phosphate-selective porin OprO and OprP
MSLSRRAGVCILIAVSAMFGQHVVSRAHADVLASNKPAEVVADSEPLTKEGVEKLFIELQKKQDEEKKKKDEDAKQKTADEGFKVGTIFSGAFRWDGNTPGVRFETENKDYSLHIGGRFQFDSVWWHEDPILRAPTQIGELQDGVFFRRVRLQMDGRFQEVFEYNLEYAFENVQQLEVGLDEFWVGITKVPGIGSIRVGHLKVPQGLEGDMVSSSKAMTFMERASYTDAFYNNFAPGIWFGNNFCDERTTYASMFYRTERGTNGTDFGDGEYAATGRLTALPVYENDGRCLVHIGVSSTWRGAEKPGNEVTGAKTVRLSARPELRDAQGDFGNNAGLPGDTGRLVDTGALTSADIFVQGAEFLSIMGPFSLQAEWAFANVENVVVGANRQMRGFNGGYMQAAYFLTGENRLYDKRFGRLGTLYDRPNTSFWAVRDEDGCWNLGRGAWEVAVRYSYLNLNDGPIDGGVMQGWTVGLNWYLNTNAKVQFEYVDDARWHKNTAPSGTVSGGVNGFGIRTQLMF